MATTGFWPVKDKLKEVIDYADNPNKNTDEKYRAGSNQRFSQLCPLLRAGIFVYAGKEEQCNAAEGIQTASAGS